MKLTSALSELVINKKVWVQGDHVFPKKRRSCMKCRRELLSSALSRGKHVASQLTSVEFPPLCRRGSPPRPHPRSLSARPTLIAQGMASWLGDHDCDHLSTSARDSMLSTVTLLCLFIVIGICDVVYDVRRYIERVWLPITTFKKYVGWPCAWLKYPRKRVVCDFSFVNISKVIGVLFIIYSRCVFVIYWNS